MATHRMQSRWELERRVMAEILRAAVVTDNLSELLRRVHDALRQLVQAENFYVALHDPARRVFSFPYFVDQHDQNPGVWPEGRGCTDYVLRHGTPLLLTADRFRELVASGELELRGSDSHSWLGVPLKTPAETIGVLAVQHYADADAYSEEDVELFSSIAGYVALAIESKRAEVQLDESRDLLRNIVESLTDGVVVFDRDFRMIYWSQGMEKITGMTRDQIVGAGKLPWQVFPHLKEQGTDELIRQAMKGEVQSREEIPYEIPNGLKGFTSDVYRPLRTADGEIRGVLGVISDVTDRKAAAEALRSSEQQLQQAQRIEAIGRLAGGIAHDFNNLLTVINGYADMALSQLGKNHPLREAIREIHSAGERAADLTSKLLAFSRKQLIEPRVIDLNQLIGALRGVLSRLLGEQIVVTTELSPEPLRSFCDPGQVEQIVMNLAVNASDAMPDGGRLIIRTSRCRPDELPDDAFFEPGRYVLLEITDNGVGMQEEVRERIFEPFFTTKGPGKGTGLGLATVYGIVKQSGGFILVDSEVGVGSTFRVYFPETDKAPTKAGRSRIEDDGHRGRGTVLVTEDELGVRSLVRTLLDSRGYRVLEAATAAEALALWEGSRQKIDLLLTDIVLPEMSGPQLVEEITRRGAPVRVVYMTGHVDETVRKQGLLQPSDRVLAKPFTAYELVKRVREAIAAGPE